MAAEIEQLRRRRASAASAPRYAIEATNLEKTYRGGSARSPG